MQDPVNLDRLRAVSMGDDEFLHELVDTYLDDAPRQLRRLQEAMLEGERQVAAECAHQVKGSAANIGAERLAAVCQSLEQAAQQGRPISEFRGEIEEEFARVTAYLDPYRTVDSAR